MALSGRNGLAVSAPKATAIAGVTAEEAAAFSVALPTRNNLIIKSYSSSASRPSLSSFDDEYDELESSPLHANTRDIPLWRSSGTMKSKETGKPIKPMWATVSAADAIVKMWRTAIAEDHASDPAQAYERNDDFDIEQFYKQIKSQRRRV